MRTLSYNGYNFFIEIKIKPRNKYVYCRYKNGVIFITTFRKLSDTEIKKIIIDNFDNLLELINKPKPTTIHYLGKEYQFKVINGKEENIIIIDDIMYINTMINTDENIKKLIYDLYTSTLKEILIQNHKYYELLFDINFNVNYNIKTVKTYFGECYSKRGLINLNTKLAKYPKDMILSVLAHELAHFKYPNHSNDFYNYLESKTPGYMKLRKKFKNLKYNDKY
jgi:predicted metal-dependent hydrolase